MMDAATELAILMERVKLRGVKLVRKSDSWFWKALDKILFVISFGKMTTFMDHATTIGKTIALPNDWDDRIDVSKFGLLTHELTHVDQFERFTIFGMAFLYLLVFFPFGLAYFRYRFEREAYLNGYSRELEYFPEARQDMIDRVADKLAGPHYLWAWPFKSMIKRWFDKNLPR